MILHYTSAYDESLRDPVMVAVGSIATNKPIDPEWNKWERKLMKSAKADNAMYAFLEAKGLLPPVGEMPRRTCHAALEAVLNTAASAKAQGNQNDDNQHDGFG